MGQGCVAAAVYRVVFRDGYESTRRAIHQARECLHPLRSLERGSGRSRHSPASLMGETHGRETGADPTSPSWDGQRSGVIPEHWPSPGSCLIGVCATLSVRVTDTSRTRWLPLVAPAWLGLIVALSACGGGHSKSAPPPRWVQRANAVCKLDDRRAESGVFDSAAMINGLELEFTDLARASFCKHVPTAAIDVQTAVGLLLHAGANASARCRRPTMRFCAPVAQQETVASTAPLQRSRGRICLRCRRCESRWCSSSDHCDQEYGVGRGDGVPRTCFTCLATEPCSYSAAASSRHAADRVTSRRLSAARSPRLNETTTSSASSRIDQGRSAAGFW